MTTDTLAAELCELINAEISLDPSIEVEPDTDLLLTDTVDSLGVVQLVTWIETRLDVKIAPSEVTIENFGSVRRMADFATAI